MRFLDWFKPQHRRYSGGNGETMEDAVVVNAPNTAIGVAAEYRYVSRRFGQPDIDWTPVLQSLHKAEDGRRYDVLAIRLKSGEVKELYFDITSFFGKF
jgi:hypothetical protein